MSTTEQRNDNAVADVPNDNNNDNNNPSNSSFSLNRDPPPPPFIKESQIIR